MIRLYLAAGVVAVVAGAGVAGVYVGKAQERENAALRAAEALSKTIQEIEDAGIDPNDTGAVNERLCALAGLGPGCLSGNE